MHKESTEATFDMKQREQNEKCAPLWIKECIIFIILILQINTHSIQTTEERLEHRTVKMQGNNALDEDTNSTSINNTQNINSLSHKYLNVLLFSFTFSISGFQKSHFKGFCQTNMPQRLDFIFLYLILILVVSNNLFKK